MVRILYFLDSLLHFYWSNANHNFKSYEELTECITLTPRQWNKTSFQTDLLRNISWLLNYDINIIGFKRTNLLNSVPNCTTHNLMCRYAFYIFKNPILKLFKNCICSIIIINYAKKHYLFVQANLNPLLINMPPDNNCCISNADILKILQRTPNTELNINVNIYSSYNYVRNNFIKHIEKNLIAQYTKSSTANTVHIFYTPHLTTSTMFNLNMLNIQPSQVPIYDHRYLGSRKTITEETYVYKNTGKNNTEYKTIQNQNFCICDHPTTTQLLLLPPYKSFKPLGKK